MVEWADLFPRHGPASRATCQDRLLPSPLRAMEAMAHGRTEPRGGHVSPCTACGALQYRDHACTNRHWPTCQNDAATPWVDTHRALLLPVPYCLVTLIV